ncbi:Rha family transcriptional regulator [Helicobacter sp. 12S02232-10]|uniref:Rha family transcriptional regulator n=1 Tax=Helicobacter sp. 12S02232-10 TaxID=1476197 RepID=UPI0021506D8B|nr:Rha family transcriptional regulator [Helicobacter sp. 12S02232-10]
MKFEVVDTAIYTTSLDIAKVFKKRHDNIIAQIRALPQDNFTALNFKETYRETKIRGFDKIAGKIRKDKYYNITRDGFSLLVMGFTGIKAYQWKIAFINAFNQMENALREQSKSNQSIKDFCKGIQEEYDLFYYLVKHHSNLAFIEKCNKKLLKIKEFEDRYCRGI